MGNLTERQQILLDKLKSEHALSIDEIQREFSISPATAYRDMQALVQSGEAGKTNRGIRLAAAAPLPGVDDRNCAFCGGSINERSVFIIQFKDGSQRKACCAHCGLLALENTEASAALTCDFLYGRMVNARQAAYLLESSVSLCCQPSVLTFSTHTEAEHFQAGFGGKVCTFKEALRRLEIMMNL